MTSRLEVAIRKQLDGFTLDVEWSAGDGVAALFGPSGAGKTLTLQCLAGLVRPDAGRIVLGDDVLFDAAAGIDVAPQRRRVGYVFQGYALFPHLTVRGNVGFGLRGRSRAGRRRREEEVLARLGLEPYAERYPRELSGGQRHPLPLSALDLPLRQALRDELGAILADWGIAAVLVTHDLTEAYRLGDRIVVYEEGRVIQAAPRAELLWRPSSRSVARIMGIRNVMQGVTLKATADRIQFRWRGQVLEAVNSPSRSYLPAPDSPLAFYIRPEYVRLLRKDRAGLDGVHHMNLMSGTVVREVDLGTSWTLFLRLDEPGPPAQGEYDLELEVPRLVYEILEIDRDRHWQFSLHRGAIHVLPSA